MADEPTSTTPPTAEEIEQMRAEVAAYDAEQAAAAAAALTAKMQPIRDAVGSDAYATVFNDLTAIQTAGTFNGDASISVHLDAILQVMPNLKVAVA